MSFKSLGLALTMVVLVATIAMAVSATGAYFSDTKNGAISGDASTLKVTTSGGTGDDGLAFQWDNMLPGQVYSATASFQNTGDSVQDVWIVFYNKTALSALNSAGTYGAARLTSSEGAYFYSSNLNDHPVDQGVGTCLGLPQMIKLASNLGPTASGSVTFSYQIASKVGNWGQGLPFNGWPVVKAGSPAGAGWPNDGAAAGYDQNFVDPADGSGTGLPFRIVATQPGILPGAAGGNAGF
jgi:hypothetical protein